MCTGVEVKGHWVTGIDTVRGPKMDFFERMDMTYQTEILLSEKYLEIKEFKRQGWSNPAGTTSSMQSDCLEDDNEH